MAVAFLTLNNNRKPGKKFCNYVVEISQYNCLLYVGFALFLPKLFKHGHYKEIDRLILDTLFRIIGCCCGGL